MGFKIRSGHVIDTLFTLALLCVFAVSSLMVVLLGADVYSSTQDRMNANYDLRCSLSYVSTKVRQSDRAGAVGLREMEGTTVLVLQQEGDFDSYETWIYHYDGALRELVTRKGNEQPLAGGQEILQLEQFEISKAGDNLYRFASVDRMGRRVELEVAPRC